MAYIVAVLNQKGGAGKTTIATHLAAGWNATLKGAVLVDSDPQGSARDWKAAGKRDLVPVYGLDRPNFEKDIAHLAKTASVIVIDGAPQIRELAVSAIKVADFIMIPVQPSPYDIWAAADLVELIKARQEVAKGKPRAAFVISRAIPRTVLGREVEEALDGYGLPVMRSQIHQRVSYPTSAAQGLTVFQTNDKDAQKEMNDLAVEASCYLTVHG